MIAELKSFEDKAPEIVFEWNDAETEAKGWIVINSLRGGAAGGGTRMRLGLDKNEVTSLAKTMEIKFAIAGPAIGGAKSGINFDPADPRKKGVLERWYKAVLPILKSYYGTGGDLNVDEIHEVIPITSSLGLLHPQEGVFIGHFKPTESEKNLAISQLQNGVSKVITDKNYIPNSNNPYVMADMITGWGVTESVKHYYSIWKNESLQGKKVIIQGWGNVAAASAFYFAQHGALIVGIIDRVGGIINPNGLTYNQVAQLFIKKGSRNYLVADGLLDFDTVNAQIWDVEADIFIPAAASRLVSGVQLERLSKTECISAGANVPFQDPEIFYGKTSAYADANFACIPDFIANCGMARTFAYLMQPNVDMSDKAIFEDVSQTISNALQAIHNTNPSSRLIMQTGYEYALSKLQKTEQVLS